ncbi:M23 family metallopeptidase [Algihabitans albus]|uniref:M23 family metallopeptidase n=1 Tax=Algihabitans albus TaxID=2164067 RepID=UPI000E5D5A20|nr:M23 family metallopeptidase [Algihabitans albus]
MIGPLFLLFLLALSAPAAALELSGGAIQGGLLYGQTVPGSQVRLEGRSVRVGPEGRFVLGFGRDAAPSATLTVRRPEGAEETVSLTVVQRDYEVQRIDGLPQTLVTPPEAVWDRIRRDAALVAEARAHDTQLPDFAAAFRQPVAGIVTGIYGSQRILNGQPRQPHYGIDIAAPEGTPVLSPAGGIVRLAEVDLYYTGGTIVLDHGHGVSSTFLHLAGLEVAVGDRVAQGDRIGTVGSTGRSTGAHLDWRINWFDERIDPQLVTDLAK